MNFPHDSLKKTKSKTDVKSEQDHLALLAQAIARQSLSHSARQLVAFKENTAQDVLTRDEYINQRIAFFGGRASEFREKLAARKILASGNFRPDLIGAKEKEENREDANSNDERGVYLGNLGVRKT